MVIVAASFPTAAFGDDSRPTQWQIDARAEALQYAPEPAEKPVICIIDTGVNQTPDLDIVSRTALDGGTPDDVTAVPGHFGHGTTVAHMAAGKVNGWGASGVFPHARIASVRIFGPGEDRVPWQRYITALQWCADVRPRPVAAVLAVGGASATSHEARDLRSVVEISRSRHQMSVVAAAGNEPRVPDMPARLAETYSVAAGARTGALCDFSARGHEIDIQAPGCDLDQAGSNGSIWRLNGTSFAAPVAAGVLAALRAYRPALTATEAENFASVSTGSSAYPQLAAAAAFQAAELENLLAPTPRAASALPPLPARVDTSIPPAAAASPGMSVPPLLAAPRHFARTCSAAGRIRVRTHSERFARLRTDNPRLRIQVHGGRIGRVVRVTHRKGFVLVRLVGARSRSAWTRLRFPTRSGQERSVIIRPNGVCAQGSTVATLSV